MEQAARAAVLLRHRSCSGRARRAPEEIGARVRFYASPWTDAYLQLLGNRLPHLHWTVAPRFRDDVVPGDPLPATNYVVIPEDEVRRDVAVLRRLLA